MRSHSLHSGVLVCDHIFKQEREIALIVHHSDGMWSFMCGQTDHDAEGDCMAVAHVEHLFDQQPAIEEIVGTLKAGQFADRVDGDWQLAAHDD